MTVSVKANEQSTQSVKYSLQDSLFTVESDSRVYYLQEIEDERYELLFGDDIFGKALEEGNFITANYITSSGDSGNGVSNFTFAGRITYTRNGVEYNVTSGISLITTGLQSSGGESIEDIASIKKYAPRDLCITK